MTDLKKAIVLIINTKEEQQAMVMALEVGYDVVREEFADGSGEASVEQDAVYRYLQQAINR